MQYRQQERHDFSFVWLIAYNLSNNCQSHGTFGINGYRKKNRVKGKRLNKIAKGRKKQNGNYKEKRIKANKIDIYSSSSIQIRARVDQTLPKNNRSQLDAGHNPTVKIKINTYCRNVVFLSIFYTRTFIFYDFFVFFLEQVVRKVMTGYTSNVNPYLQKTFIKQQAGIAHKTNGRRKLLGYRTATSNKCVVNEQFFANNTDNMLYY